DTMTLDIREREFFISDPKSLWKGKSLYELYDEAHTPWDWHAAIFERARPTLPRHRRFPVRDRATGCDFRTSPRSGMARVRGRPGDRQY
ncbi:hypothetical protein AB4Z34_34815, partial [Ensifer sp. 2YAB10]